MTFAAGQTVQTPLGKGTVLEVRNGRRVRVQLGARVVTFDIGDLQHAPARRGASARPPRGSDDLTVSESGPVRGSERDTRTVDLHGLTVEQAMESLIRALDHALRADASELRIVHGRSGGRIRRAVHARLRELSFVRAYRLDPNNDGATIAQL